MHLVVCGHFISFFPNSSSYAIFGIFCRFLVSVGSKIFENLQSSRERRMIGSDVQYFTAMEIAIATKNFIESLKISACECNHSWRSHTSICRTIFLNAELHYYWIIRKPNNDISAWNPYFEERKCSVPWKSGRSFENLYNYHERMQQLLCWACKVNSSKTNYFFGSSVNYNGLAKISLGTKKAKYRISTAQMQMLHE